MARYAFFQTARSFAIHTARWYNRLGCVLLAAMAIFMTADVLLRSLTGSSIPGVFEVVELLMGALVGCGLAFTGATHSHLDVEIVTNLMPLRIRRFLGVLMNTLGMLFCMLAGWKTLSHAWDAFLSTECTPTTSIRTWPFIGMLGLGFAMQAAVFFLHIWESDEGEQCHDA